MKKKPEDMTREELIAVVQKMREMQREHMRSEQQKKIRSFKEMNQYAQKGQILFTGSSLMEQFPVTEYSMSKRTGKSSP